MELLGHTRVTVKPVIDLADQAPVDGYQTPAAMRERVLLRTPADVFPHAVNRDRGSLDLDHTRPYQPMSRGGPPGQTRPGNLGPMTRRHHRIKTHCPGWEARQPTPGVYLWRTPHGYYLRVDNTGTHHLDPAHGRALWARATSDDAA